jgi:hypothetical protein
MQANAINLLSLDSFDKSSASGTKRDQSNRTLKTRSLLYEHNNCLVLSILLPRHISNNDFRSIWFTMHAFSKFLAKLLSTPPKHSFVQYCPGGH